MLAYSAPVTAYLGCFVLEAKQFVAPDVERSEFALDPAGGKCQVASLAWDNANDVREGQK
jgi:hypothetical protein